MTDEPRLDVSVSKVKLIRNAKGDPQWEITVVAGSTEQEMTGLRVLAIQQHQQLMRELLQVAS